MLINLLADGEDLLFTLSSARVTKLRIRFMFCVAIKLSLGNNKKIKRKGIYNWQCGKIVLMKVVRSILWDRQWCALIRNGKIFMYMQTCEELAAV